MLHLQNLPSPANTESLDVSFLESPMPSLLQEKIISHLWGIVDRYPKRSFRPYLQYYSEQCRRAVESRESCLEMRTHEHLVEVAACIQKGDSWSDVRNFIQQCKWTSNPPSDKAINASIDLTVRILYMIDVGGLANAHYGRERLIWNDGFLQDFMRAKFPETCYIEDGEIKLGVEFKICNIDQIAGFQVVPTSNLYDHLRIIDRRVEIFHHASFLESHREDQIFPNHLVDETLETLALLFPQGDKRTKKWFKRLKRQHGPEELDGKLLRCGKAERQIRHYKYWHDRLIELKIEFDKSRPSTFAQWWNDRRDVSQWYPLWVAIGLTVLFGLIQSIEGALQVYKAYNP